MSGSDTESDSDDDDPAAAAAAAANRRPQVDFCATGSDEHLLVYKAVLASPAEQRAGIDAAGWTVRLRALLNEPQPWRWAVLMSGGGHFAAAVFENRRIVVSKTFHRYTTRRKQGGSQSANDQAKGKAKSAGAALRRYNERALEADIHGLLRQWRGHLDACQLVFLAIPSQLGRSTIFDTGTITEAPVLRADDPRVRRVPFTTRRPTKTEVERVHTLLASALIVVPPDATEAPAPPTTAPVSDAAPPAPSTSTRPAAVAVEERPPAPVDPDVLVLRTALEQLVVVAAADPEAPPPAAAIARSLPDAADRRRYLLAYPLLEDLNALQWAALQNNAAVVRALLDAGADPAAVTGPIGRPVCQGPGAVHHRCVLIKTAAERLFVLFNRAASRTTSPRTRTCGSSSVASWASLYVRRRRYARPKHGPRGADPFFSCFNRHAAGQVGLQSGPHPIAPHGWPGHRPAGPEEGAEQAPQGSAAAAVQGGDGWRRRVQQQRQRRRTSNRAGTPASGWRSAAARGSQSQATCSTRCKHGDRT